MRKEKKKEISGVYIIRNKVNGKCDIGSSYTIYKRWAEHKKSLKVNKHHSIKLQRSWNKHGKDNFSFDVLEEMFFPKDYDKVLIRELLECREQYYLDTILFASEKNDKFDKLGYNIKRIAGNGNLGGTRSKKGNEKASISMKELWKDEKYREKMSIALIGVNSGNIRDDLRDFNISNKSKKVCQYDFEGNLLREWNSLEEIHRELKLEQVSISKACRGKLKKSQGFVWRFKSDIDDEKIDIGNINHPASKCIIKYDLSGNFMEKYYSMCEAERKTGIGTSHISDVCNGIRLTAGGYKWTFEKCLLDLSERFNKKSTIVAQYNIKKELIGVFKSMNKAEKETKSWRTTIEDCLSGKRKFCNNNFTWKHITQSQYISFKKQLELEAQLKLNSQPCPTA